MSRLRIEEHELGYGRLPSGLEGLRILQISDLHMTRWSDGRDRVVAERVAGMAVDLVLLTGDFVNHARHWSRLGDWLAASLPPVPRVAVPGNWDYRTDKRLERMGEVMARAGVSLLVNDSARIPHGESGLRVVGVDDIRCGALDLSRAFRDVEAGEFVVVACHSPDILLHLDSDHFRFLVCGHTHGGQIRIPGYGAIYTSTKLGRRYDTGLYELGPDRYAYVSRGVGVGQVPIRICCSPELALFRLRRILKHPLQPLGDMSAGLVQ